MISIVKKSKNQINRLIQQCLKGLSQQNQQNSFSSSQQETDFGFKNVKIEQKQQLVNEVFHSVADKYDIMNDLLSVGIHRIWKNTFVQDIGVIRPQQKIIIDKETNKSEVQFIQPKVLDVAGGTGDISFRILEKYRQEKEFQSQTDIDITVCDINESMLQVGEQRAQKLGYDKEISFRVGNAENLADFEDDTFDLYTISFGLRNVPRKDLALKEAFRVLKKGGRFMCLEFSKVQVEPLSQVYKFYNANILPIVGSIVANDSHSYQYLAESIEKFHDQETLLKMIQDAGFSFSSYKNLSQGICAIHTGFKL